jgi:hypothetical protein
VSAFYLQNGNKGINERSELPPAAIEVKVKVEVEVEAKVKKDSFNYKFLTG